MIMSPPQFSNIWSFMSLCFPIMDYDGLLSLQIICFTSGDPLYNVNELCNRVGMDWAKQKKVEKYEKFVDQRLKPDLVRAMAERCVRRTHGDITVTRPLPCLLPEALLLQGEILSCFINNESKIIRVALLFPFIHFRDKVFEQQKIFSDLKRNIENLEKNNATSLRTLVSLGSEVYMQADVPDTSHLFVDVELGFHVEFTRSEALNIGNKEEQISSRI